jgi:hypothetical protein
LLGQRFVERRIYDYKMLLDLDDHGSRERCFCSENVNSSTRSCSSVC